jgi:hypothetical protein
MFSFGKIFIKKEYARLIGPGIVAAVLAVIGTCMFYHLSTSKRNCVSQQIWSLLFLKKAQLYGLNCRYRNWNQKCYKSLDLLLAFPCLNSTLKNRTGAAPQAKEPLLLRVTCQLHPKYKNKQTIHVWMRSSLVGMRSSLVGMRSSLVWMRSSLVVRASDCQCTSCNGPGFDPSIRRHSGIWGAADEAVLNTVWLYTFFPWFFYGERGIREGAVGKGFS